MDRSSQNLPILSGTGQKQPTPYRTFKSHVEPATSIQQQLQLSSTGRNHLELAIAIKQHLTHTNTVQNFQEPRRTCNNYSKAAKTILNWPELFKTGHKHQVASKSSQNSREKSTGRAKKCNSRLELARTYHNRVEQASSIQHRTDLLRAIYYLQQLSNTATAIFDWPKPSRNGQSNKPPVMRAETV